MIIILLHIDIVLLLFSIFKKPNDKVFNLKHSPPASGRATVGLQLTEAKTLREAKGDRAQYFPTFGKY
jgi:hypothetical protein